MRKLLAKFAFFSVFLLFILEGKVVSRHLQYNDTELVSNGVSDGSTGREGSILRLKRMDSSEEECELMYGFLPCSTNIWSHIFLIVIYEYLLYHGESYAGGDGRIYRVLGKNFFVTCLSQLLDSLPDSLILLATGLASSDKEKAQYYVATGAGLLVGSSILLLTLLWGVCFICARTKFYVQPGSRVQNQVGQLLTGSGVLTDGETSFHAKVMFFSLIPFVIIMLPGFFGVSYLSQEYNIILLVSLATSVICLISYFYYQHFDHRIWIRRQEYAEVEQKVEMHVPFYEVQALMLDRDKYLMIRQKEMENMIQKSLSNEETTSMEKLNHMFGEWLDVTKNVMDNPYAFDKMETEYNQVVELLLEEKSKLIGIMSKMMERALGQRLLNEDGIQDESAIDRFFEDIDADKNGSITRIELKNYIMKINYEETLVDDEIAEIIMRHLDIDGNGDIDRDEFKSGVRKWRASRNLHKKLLDRTRTDRYHQTEAKAKTKEKIKAIIFLILGIFMLTILAEPLMESVRKFSESVNIEPFYASFIFVPLATNARTAIAAIRAAKQKRHHTTSLTFSEIYHKVFLNNILGLSVLVSVIYYRGLTWHFSAEILVAVIVCVIMGTLASLNSKFPNWTAFIPFALYPLSMVVVYFINDVFIFT